MTRSFQRSRVCAAQRRKDLCTRKKLSSVCSECWRRASRILAVGCIAGFSGSYFWGAATAQTPFAAGTSPFSSVYSLQALIDFDSLDGAQYDPTTKTLALFGRRARFDQLIRIPYLDHLAAAMEADAPTLTLTWTSNSRRDIERAKEDRTAFFKIMDGSRRINALGSWLFRKGGVDVAPGTEIDYVGEQVAKAGGLQRMFQAGAAIHVPPDMVRLAFAAEPRARPEIKGMSPRSLLAHVALEADIQSKMISEMPELKLKVGGYQTWSEWERTHGSVDEDQRTWISPGRFEISVSADERTLRFRQIPMKFNIQKYVAGKSVPDPILTGYAELLTGGYDALAVEFPVLHELRECAKIMAIRSWLKRNGWRPDLPREGRADW
jgi:hypothetical protein